MKQDWELMSSTDSLSVCLLAALLQKLWTDCDEILWRGPRW